MKYLSLLFFTALMVWTWDLIHSASLISFETHSGIQDKLALLIQDTVKAKKPTVTDVHVERVWTEAIGTGKVKAHFKYSYTESADHQTTETLISGEGLLEKQPADESGLDRWSLSHVKTTNDAILFEDAMLITPGDQPAKDSTVTPPPQAE